MKYQLLTLRSSLRSGPLRGLIRSLLLVVFGLVLLLDPSPAPAQAPGPHAVYLPAIVAQYEPPWDWTTNPPVTLAPTPARLMASLDAQGRLHLFWDTYTTPRYIYTTMLAEGAWSEIQPIALSLGSASLVSYPHFTAGGKGYLAWRAYYGASGNPDYRVWLAEFDGQRWSSAQEIFATDYSATSGLPRLDRRGQLRVLVIDGTVYTSHPHLITRTFSGWSDSGSISPPGWDVMYWVVQFWPDLYGGVRFYANDNAENLYYAYWLDGVFLEDRVSEPGTLWGRKSQFDGRNNLHLYWTGYVPVPGNTVLGLSTQCLDSQLNWGPLRVLSGYNTVYGEIALANNHAGRLAFAWEEVESRRFRVGVLDGCALYRLKSVPSLDPVTHSTAAVALSPDGMQACVVVESDYAQSYVSQCAPVD